MGLGDNCKTRRMNLPGNVLRTCLEICAVPAVALKIIVHRWWSVWKCHSASKMFPNFEYHWMCSAHVGCPTAWFCSVRPLPFGAIWRTRYTKHIQPILMTYSIEFRSIFRGPIKKRYVLWYPFHCKCRSLLKDKVVIYKVWYSNNTINMNSHGHVT
jgi:hypothetical protein